MPLEMDIKVRMNMMMQEGPVKTSLNYFEYEEIDSKAQSFVKMDIFIVYYVISLTLHQNSSLYPDSSSLYVSPTCPLCLCL